jgi:hypothetical protein
MNSVSTLKTAHFVWGSDWCSPRGRNLFVDRLLTPILTRLSECEIITVTFDFSWFFSIFYGDYSKFPGLLPVFYNQIIASISPWTINWWRFFQIRPGLPVGGKSIAVRRHAFPVWECRADGLRSVARRSPLVCPSVLVCAQAMLLLVV